MESVFRGKDSYIDFSYDLRDKRDWKTATIREVEYLSDVSAFAVEATNGLIAIGQSIHDPQKEDANLRTNKTYLWSPLQRHQTWKDSCFRRSPSWHNSQDIERSFSKISTICSSCLQALVHRYSPLNRQSYSY